MYKRWHWNQNIKILGIHFITHRMYNCIHIHLLLYDESNLFMGKLQVWLNYLDENKSTLVSAISSQKIMYLHGSNQTRMNSRCVVINFEHQFSKPQGTTGLSTFIHTNMWYKNHRILKLLYSIVQANIYFMNFVNIWTLFHLI